jgi:glycosyltransferase involved in cell wall biosynthesis
MDTSSRKANNIRLYVLSSLYPNTIGGMEIFNYYFLSHQLIHAQATIYYSTPDNAVLNDNGHLIPLKKIWPVRLFYPIQFFFLIWKLRKKIDLTYLSHAKQSWIILFSQSLILRLFKIPYVITIHSGKAPDWKFKYPFKSFFANADYVIGVSEPICAAFKRVIPNQAFHYIPPLIPFETASKSKEELRKELGYSDSDNILLYVGSIKGMKNPDKIVSAFEKLGVDFLQKKNIKMVFAGSGEMQAQIKKMISEYHLDNYIEMLGLVSRENIPDYYRLADAYIISSDYEGTSLSLLEAMFNKLPIIGSNAPGINKMLKHEQNAFLYSTHNTDELAATIKRIFLDKAISAKLAENALIDFHAKYSFESIMQQYEEVFSSFPV